MSFITVPVEEFTTPDPVTVNESMAIDGLLRLMDQHGIRHLPVMRDNAVVGIISDRDARLVSGLTSDEKRHVCAADIMVANPITVSAITPLDEVAYLMSDKKVGSVIVNEENGSFLGIFTASDALNALIEIVRNGGPAT